jgi:hypothetical protein
MRPRRRWIAGGLGVVLALGVAGYAGASYYGYGLLASATPLCDGRFPDDTPASFGTKGIFEEFTAGGFDTTPYAMPGYRDVSFPSRDARQPRLTIRASWVPAEKAGAAAVIVIHGRNSCRHDPVVLLPAGILARNGFSVLMIDLRDHGDSDIEDGRSGWGSEEYLDVLGAWDWLQSAQGLRPSRIGLMGEVPAVPRGLLELVESLVLIHPDWDEGLDDQVPPSFVRGTRIFGAVTREADCQAVFVWGYHCPFAESKVRVDHLIPYGPGGPTDPDDAVWLCAFHQDSSTC